MSIKNTLLTFFSILAVFIAGFSGVNVYDAWQQKQIFTFSKNSNETIDLLLEAAGNWAVERGVTNAALSADTPVNEDMLKIIMTRRTNGNAAFDKAIKQMASYEFEGKEALSNVVAEAFNKANKYRAQADKNLTKPKIFRDATLLKSWVPTMSKLIVSSQDLRFALTEKTAMTDAELGRQSQLKHFQWMMSEYSGRERAIIGGMISSGTMMSNKKLATLSKYRGNVETGWGIVKKLGAHSSGNVKNEIQKVDSTFFKEFQTIRNAVYAAATNGSPYPLTTKKWIADSTNAINSILAMQTASGKETERYVDSLLASANQRLWLNLGLLALNAITVIAALYVLICKVIRPLHAMTDCMNILAEGNTNVDIPGTGRKDEIGNMAASIEVFKDNAIEQNLLKEKEKEAFAREQELQKQAEAERLARVQEDAKREARLKEEELQRKLKEEKDAQQRELEAEAARKKAVEEQEKLITQEVSSVIEACARGDYTQRLDTKGKDGLLKTLGESMNNIGSTTLQGLQTIRKALEALAEGDLNYRINEECYGIFDNIKEDFNKTVEHLESTVRQIRHASDSVSNAAEETAQASQDLAQRTENQAATIAETSASMKAITNAVEENTSNAQSAQKLSQESAEVAQRGAEVVQVVVRTMNDISNASNKVANIVSVIDEIAFQTNLLAINAAVEAARAGEAGKGFAVVASEVRSLAGRSASASKEIKNLITQNLQKVTSGVELVNQSGETLEEINSSVNTVQELVKVISISSSEQLRGILEINSAISNMDETTQQNAALVEENTATAHSLSDQGKELVNLICFFKV